METVTMTRAFAAAAALALALPGGCSKDKKDKGSETTPRGEATAKSGKADPNPTDKQPDKAPAVARVGRLAPDFTTKAHTGETITLSKLRGQPVVLYFYPKDETPG